MKAKKKKQRGGGGKKDSAGHKNGFISFHQFFFDCLSLDTSKRILNLSDVRGKRNLRGLVERDKDPGINFSQLRKSSFCPCYVLSELVCSANLHLFPSSLV